MDQKLLKKVAERLGKDPQNVRLQAIRRAGREGVVSDVALINMARDLNVGVASAIKKLQPQYLQQLSAARVVTTRAPAQRPALARQRAAATARPKKPTTKVLVFISHSSDDKKVAARLVDLLHRAFNLSAEKILATSVEGHKLEAGAETDEALRTRVLACEVLIGIITPSSRRSTYVLLELGARWGAGKALIPLTACGVTPGELRGPLARKNAMDCSVRTDVLQLVSDIGTKLGRQSEKAPVYDNDVNRLVRASKAAAKKRPRRSRAK